MMVHMKKAFLLPLFLSTNTIFADLPVIGMLHGEEVPGFSAVAGGTLLGSFEIVGDGEKTPFKLQVTFKNCRELKNRYGFALPLTSIKLKYRNTPNGAFKEDMYLAIASQGQNCFSIVNFLDDVQDRYYMELWASWNGEKAKAGIFYGEASFKILPQY